MDKNKAIDNQEFPFQKIFDQFMEFFVLPSLKKRQLENELPEQMELTAAQIIFYPDGRETEVRINSEVKAVSMFKLKEGITKVKGEPIYPSEIENIEQIQVYDFVDQDAAHATLIKINDVWSLSFDFRYNKKFAREHLEAAQEFFSVAEYAMEKQYFIPFIDNLFSSCELTAKALLLMTPDQQFRKKASHRSIHKRFNRFVGIGNLEPKHSSAFNKLYSYREKVRYIRDKPQSSREESLELMATVKEMIRHGREFMNLSRSTVRTDKSSK